MLFNSWIFAPFLLIVLALHAPLGRRGQNVLLLVASYVFYGAWDYRFLFLLLASTVIDFELGLALAKARDLARRRSLLVMSVAVNLGILAFFKYSNFFIENARVLIEALGGSPGAMRGLEVILPVGVSFYTFQSLSYTIDIYRGELEPTDDFLDYAIFVAFFPQLVAGPIERASWLLPQVQKPRVRTRDDWVEGGWLILWGYFKKMVIADNLAGYVDTAFNAASPPRGLACLVAIYAFAFQIYGDFSGYTDIARGLARWLGFDLQANFRLPYIARDPSEFWRRWHISLSSWLRDYLYVPLGGNRHGRARTYRNLLLTMVLGGLWHGAAWTFVLWGTYHGVLLVVHRWWTERHPDRPAPPRHSIRSRVSAFFMFHAACLGWLFFRSSSVSQASDILTGVFSGLGWDLPTCQAFAAVVALGGILWCVELWSGGLDDPRQRPGWRLGLGPWLVTALLLGIVLLAPPTARSFIYFQF